MLFGARDAVALGGWGSISGCMSVYDFGRRALWNYDLLMFGVVGNTRNLGLSLH